MDSILHAEHKRILEEMRTDYFLNHAGDNEERKDNGLANADGKSGVNGDNSDSVSDSINGIGRIGDSGEKPQLDMQLNFYYGLDLRNLLVSSEKIDERCSNGESRYVIKRCCLSS